MSEATTTDGGPAFPGVSADGKDEHVGMSLRDYFAAKAMAAHICASPSSQNYSADPVRVAEWSYADADAMLKARGNEVGSDPAVSAEASRA